MALIFLIIIIALILGLIGSFIGGIVTIILTVKRAKKRKAEGLSADGRQVFMIVLSVLLLIAPVGAGGAIIANRASLAIKRAGYSNFTDR
ncbi:MAG: hypothetical protein J6X85_05080, partial [Ruminococcus sp.]|nr:hypothetical protein [Ruminococcus sp.]